MLIVCPSCATSYQIDATSVGARDAWSDAHAAGRPGSPARRGPRTRSTPSSTGSSQRRRPSSRRRSRRRARAAASDEPMTTISAERPEPAPEPFQRCGRRRPGRRRRRGRAADRPRRFAVAGAADRPHADPGAGRPAEPNRPSPKASLRGGASCRGSGRSRAGRRAGPRWCWCCSPSTSRSSARATRWYVILPQTASLFAAIGLPVNLRQLDFEDVHITRETR